MARVLLTNPVQGPKSPSKVSLKDCQAPSLLRPSDAFLCLLKTTHCSSNLADLGMEGGED